MTPELTKENIEGAIQGAKQRPSLSHPVVQAMHGDYEFKAMLSVREQVNPRRAVKYAEQRFAEMIDRIQGVRDFTLGPLDIVSIWACTEEASKGQQIALARFITARHAVSTEESPIGHWRTSVPLHFMKEGTLLPEVAHDLPGLEYVLGRITVAFESCKQIEAYLYGPGGSNQYGILMVGSDLGDRRAITKLDNLLDGYYKRSNPTLEGVLNVFEPEIVRFGNAVSEAIDQCKIGS